MWWWARKLGNVRVPGVHNLNSKKTKVGQGSGRPRTVLTDAKLQELRVALDAATANDTTETKCHNSVGLASTTFQRAVKTLLHLHPYKLRVVQVLVDGDAQDHVEFA